MKKEKFFAVRQLAGQKKERVQAEGYRVERGRFAFYICGSGGSWGVTEAKSGMLIGVYGKTRKECIEKFARFWALVLWRSILTAKKIAAHGGMKIAAPVIFAR